MFATVGRARPTRSAICFLGQVELVAQLAVCARLLHRVEVGALEVLHERELELIAARRAWRTMAGIRSSPAICGGPEAALAGDEAVAVEGLGDEHGLQDAVGSRCWRRARRAPRQSKAVRGWYGLRSIRSIGISDRAAASRRSPAGSGRREPRRDRSGTRSASAARRAHAGRLAHQRGGRARAPCVDAPVGDAARRLGGRARRLFESCVQGDRPAVARRLGRRTLRGTTVSKTASPRWRRTSAATSAERFVRASNIVRTTPLTARAGFR